MKATAKVNDGKVRFNEVEKNHIRKQAEETAEIYFGSLNTKIDDMSGNISDRVSAKVVKDVTEVINPAFDKFFKMDKKTNNRINGVIAGVVIAFIVFGIVFWKRTEKKEAIHAATYNTEMPHNIIGVR
jgi:hypothetical protein